MTVFLQVPEVVAQDRGLPRRCLALVLSEAADRSAELVLQLRVVGGDRARVLEFHADALERAPLPEQRLADCLRSAVHVLPGLRCVVSDERCDLAQLLARQPEPGEHCLPARDRVVVEARLALQRLPYLVERAAPDRRCGGEVAQRLVERGAALLCVLEGVNAVAPEVCEPAPCSDEPAADRCADRRADSRAALRSSLQVARVDAQPSNKVRQLLGHASSPSL